MRSCDGSSLRAWSGGRRDNASSAAARDVWRGRALGGVRERRDRASRSVSQARCDAASGIRAGDAASGSILSMQKVAQWHAAVRERFVGDALLAREQVGLALCELAPTERPFECDGALTPPARNLPHGHVQEGLISRVARDRHPHVRELTEDCDNRPLRAATPAGFQLNIRRYARASFSRPSVSHVLQGLSSRRPPGHSSLFSTPSPARSLHAGAHIRDAHGCPRGGCFAALAHGHVPCSAVNMA